MAVIYFVADKWTSLTYSIRSHIADKNLQPNGLDGNVRCTDTCPNELQFFSVYTGWSEKVSHGLRKRTVARVNRVKCARKQHIFSWHRFLSLKRLLFFNKWFLRRSI